MRMAASPIGVEVEVAEASDSRGIEAAFATLAGNRADALVVGTDPFFFRRRVQLTTLATRHALPTVYNAREYAEAGGLMSYGTSLKEAFRQTGVYAGRILKGEKPADLPVVQSTTITPYFMGISGGVSRKPHSPSHSQEGIPGARLSRGQCHRCRY